MDFQPIIDFIRSLYPNRDFIPLHEPVFTGNEKKYVLDCIDSTYVSSVGKYVDQFEQMICEYTGTQYAVATVNGTAALHLALLLAGVSRGDLVITQPLTFIATCNAISYCGAEPVFIDIDERTLGLSATALEAWLSENVEIVDKDLEGLERSNLEGLESLDSQLPKPSQLSILTQPSKPSQLSEPIKYCIHKQSGRRISACVPMHTFGHPCEIDRIMEICSKYSIPLIEDAAESIGSLYKSQHTGTLGLMGILSFNGNKTITTGGGGMILTNDEELGRLAKHLSTQAKQPHAWKFEHDYIGYNYRMPNINAALGCAQLEKIGDYIKSKRDIAQAYSDFFPQNGIKFMHEPADSRSNYWLNAIMLDNEAERDEFLKLSNACKVMTRPAWTLMNKLAMFRHNLTSDLSVSEFIEARLVNLPSGVIL